MVSIESRSSSGVDGNLTIAQDRPGRRRLHTAGRYDGMADEPSIDPTEEVSAARRYEVVEESIEGVGVMRGVAHIDHRTANLASEILGAPDLNLRHGHQPSLPRGVRGRRRMCLDDRSGCVRRAASDLEPPSVVHNSYDAKPRRGGVHPRQWMLRKAPPVAEAILRAFAVCCGNTTRFAPST
jgi:hypothetical protein